MRVLAAICTISPLAGAVAHAEPKDWQFTIGKPALEARAHWSRLTRGEELARGRQVVFSSQPAYPLTHDAKDALDLTDGRLSERIDDRIWFNKDAVGWSFGSGSESAGGVSLRIDLGSVQPVGQIAIRLLGGREQSGLVLPSGIEFLASTDGRNFHSLRKLKKLWPAERELSDFRTGFYVAENGAAFVYPFVCAEAVRARWIVIRIMPQADVYTDEISVLRAKPTSFVGDLKSFPVARLFSDGLVVKPKRDSLVVTTNITTPNWLLSQAYGKDAASGRVYGLRLSLPVGLRLNPLSEPVFTELPVKDGYRQYHFERIALTTAASEGKLPLYIQTVPGETMPKGAKAVLTGTIDGVDSHALEYPVQLIQMPRVPDELSHILTNCPGWVSDYEQQHWPGYLKNLRSMGFGMVPTFPMWWDIRDGKVMPSSQAYLDFVLEAKRLRFGIVQIDSPCGGILREARAALKSGPEEASEARLALNQVDGKPGNFLNPLYRGRLFQDEVRRIAMAAAIVQPDQVHWNIYLYEAVRESRKDPRVQQAWRRSGKSWKVFISDAGNDMLRIFTKAVRDAVPGKTVRIGLYNCDVDNSFLDGIFDWNAIQPPRIMDLVQPALYVQGRTLEVARKVRGNYSDASRRVIVPWLTAGTYGEFEPRQMESMVLEALLNGAGGFTSYYYPDYDPLDFYYQSKALATLGRYPDLLRNGRPVRVGGDNAALNYTGFSDGREALIVVGNYARSRNTKATVPVVVRGVKTVSVAGRGPAMIRNGRIGIEVPAGEFRLIHMKS